MCNTWKKNTVVMDFKKQKNRIGVKDKFCCFNKTTKIGVFYIEKKIKLLFFIDRQKMKSNMWK
jgi:hypothetical protein